MGVLELLISKDQTVVSRTEILEEVWGDKYANDQGLTQAVSRLRSIFESNRSATIRTIPKKGYLFESHKPKRNLPKSIKINLNAVIIIILLIVIGLLFFVRRIEIRVDELEPQGTEEVSGGT